MTPEREQEIRRVLTDRTNHAEPGERTRAICELLAELDAMREELKKFPSVFVMDGVMSHCCFIPSGNPGPVPCTCGLMFKDYEAWCMHVGSVPGAPSLYTEEEKRIAARIETRKGGER